MLLLIVLTLLRQETRRKENNNIINKIEERERALEKKDKRKSAWGLGCGVEACGGENR